MTNEEIETAIAKKRLPLDWGDKIGLISAVFLLLFVLFKSHDLYLRRGLTTMLGGFLIVLPVAGIIIGKIFWLNILTDYPSNLSLDNKEQIIEKMLKESNESFTKDERNIYIFYSKSKTFSPSIKTLILYDKSGYYINSVMGSGNSAWLASAKIAHLIDKIKQFESEL